MEINLRSNKADPLPDLSSLLSLWNDKMDQRSKVHAYDKVSFIRKERVFGIVLAGIGVILIGIKFSENPRG
ncbi:MAG TPA: hypothetical protein EYQ50_11215 [Verrucomicrobiales bacterium]|nr:hypothetical protein [Verrucomicrobiales bacterium]HIL69414.1 hypothetical protein [Verrucomicrobiota bacterium]